MVRSVTPDGSHAAFDRLCAEIDDYDALPNPQEQALRAAEDGEPEEQLDDQILGGFLTP